MDFLRAIDRVVLTSWSSPRIPGPNQLFKWLRRTVMHPHRTPKWCMFSSPEFICMVVSWRLPAEPETSTCCRYNVQNNITCLLSHCVTSRLVSIQLSLPFILFNFFLERQTPDWRTDQFSPFFFCWKINHLQSIPLLQKGVVRVGLQTTLSTPPAVKTARISQFLSENQNWNWWTISLEREKRCRGGAAFDLWSWLNQSSSLPVCCKTVSHLNVILLFIWSAPLKHCIRYDIKLYYYLMLPRRFLNVIKFEDCCLIMQFGTDAALISFVFVSFSLILLYWKFLVLPRK